MNEHICLIMNINTLQMLLPYLQSSTVVPQFTLNAGLQMVITIYMHLNKLSDRISILRKCTLIIAFRTLNIIPLSYTYELHLSKIYSNCVFTRLKHLFLSNNLFRFSSISGTENGTIIQCFSCPMRTIFWGLMKCKLS